MSQSPTRLVTPVLEVTGVTKRFGSVVANSNISFDLKPGEIHALVGENGAGKTTLMRILYGMCVRDSGSVQIRGSEVNFRRPSEAIDQGVGMVHQHFMLVPSFTVMENLTLGIEPGKFGLFDKRAAAESVLESMERLGIEMDPQGIVGELSVASQQKLEIMKILHRGASILIMDEPTAVLTPQETIELFDLLRGLAQDGSSIIFISHKLREVFAIADRITVLRNGSTVETFLTEGTDPAEVVAAMTGRDDVNLGRMERDSNLGDVVLSVNNLSCVKPAHDSGLHQVSFQVRAGEIVGIAGVEGNGQSVLAEALIGTIPLASGDIAIQGIPLAKASVSERRNKGLAYVPEDRQLEGLPINGAVWEGLVAGRLRNWSAWRSLANAFPKSSKSWVQDLINRYSIRTPGYNVACSSLSGGNQQKLVVARELEAQPTCLVLAQPTRGVDLGAIEFIYQQIIEATSNGCAVVLISADLDEIMRLTDRVLVMYGGQIVADEVTTSTTREQLGMHMMGSVIGTGAA